MKTNEDAMLALLGAEIDETSAAADAAVAEERPDSKLSATNKQGKGLTSSTEEKALELLGQGIDPVVVANALGVAPGRISQLLSNKEFSKRVVDKRFSYLASSTERDKKYDNLEDQLLAKLESSVPFMHKTNDMIRALQTVNNAKRRGQQNPAQLTSTDKIVPLIMPAVVIEQFSAVTNQVNQVVRAGDQDLVTMQSGSLMNTIKAKQEARKQAALEETKQTTDNKGEAL